MYNIIKAQMYQLIRENATYYTFLGGLGALLFLYISLSDSNIEIAEVTGSELLVQGTSSMVLMFVAMLFTVRICGGDMGDKTINHEMLTGISRAKIYGGRIVVSVIFALIVYILFAVTPIAVFTVINGWGYTAPVKEAFIRLGLQIFPYLRLVLFFASLTFITMQPAAIILVSFVLMLVEGLFDLVVTEVLERSDKILYPFLGIIAMDRVNVYNMTYGYIDGEDVEVLKNGLSTGTIVSIAVPSVIFGIIFLIAGYCIFRKKDMK